MLRPSLEAFPPSDTRCVGEDAGWRGVYQTGSANSQRSSEALVSKTRSVTYLKPYSKFLTDTFPLGVLDGMPVPILRLRELPVQGLLRRYIYPLGCRTLVFSLGTLPVRSLRDNG